ncbi:MAG: c-type cytochrome [Rhodocyclales bacterium]|nr:c-type cytochrome [Rhodocyclales bacterium]
MSVGLAQAQAAGKSDIGKREYMSNCVVCHGQGGKGDGSYADLLKRPASDLTVLKKNNGGVFPFERVYAQIDGREAVKGHGDRDMPVWGSDYSASKAKAAEYYVDVPYDTEMYVRARILALIDYLNRLQAK